MFAFGTRTGLSDVPVTTKFATALSASLTVNGIGPRGVSCLVFWFEICERNGGVLVSVTTESCPQTVKAGAMQKRRIEVPFKKVLPSSLRGFIVGMMAQRGANCNSIQAPSLGVIPIRTMIPEQRLNRPAARYPVGLDP
jgi:hypothetical protein